MKKMMSLSGNIMVYLTLIYTSLFLMELVSARSNSIREVRRNSLNNRVNKGKRTWSSEPLMKGNNNNNAEQDIKASDDPQLQSQPQSSNGGSNSAIAAGLWLELEGVPPARVSVKLHSDLTLECQAVGSLPPTIYWLKNGKPLDSGLPYNSDEIMNNVDVSRFSGTPIRGQNGVIVAKTKSKLPLLCIRPEDEGTYSCVADNGGRQVISSTLVVIEEDDPSDEIRPECEYKLSIFFNNKKGKKGTPAYVLTAETLHMESIGSDVVLPCRGAGRPRPKIEWTDADGQRIVSGKRFQVNSNGNLLIRNLSWKDMGSYECIAENPFGRDSVSTFLYPLMTEGGTS